MVQAGFYECDITPPFGADCPGDFFKRRVEKHDDPLKVRVLALSDGSENVALIGLDTLGCGSKFLETLKAALPEVRIITSSSHTHYGGNMRDEFPGIDEADEVIRRIVLEERVSHDANYYEFCMRQCITAVNGALAKLEEADFSFGRGRVENLIFNRRIRMKDGSVKTHAGKGNPDAAGYAGPVDDELGVMGIWKKDSSDLLGFVINFSCHACINLEGATADFPGVAIDTVRGVFGSDKGAVYLNGASGDVTQIDNMSLKLDTGKPMAIKLGRAVGCEAARLLAIADRGPVKTLKYLSRDYAFRLTPDDPEEIAEAWQTLEKRDDSAEYRFASSLVVKALEHKADPRPTAELAVLQIGPLVIGSSPCEMFARFALDFKAQSKFPYTWFSQLSFIRCYIPTADAFDPETGGGYEAATAEFVPETGDEITGIITELAGELTPEPAPEPETVPPVVSTWHYNFKRKK